MNAYKQSADDLHVGNITWFLFPTNMYLKLIEKGGKILIW